MGSSSSKSTSTSYSSDRQLVRYDENAARKARRHDKSDFTSVSALKYHLQPGDLIQQKGDTFKEFFYSHWAVYIGNGYVVHVTQVYGSSEKADIMRQTMEDAFGDKNVRKNNHMDDMWPPRTQRDIVITARGSVGTKWEYNLFSKNCEHFASYCRYGKEISLQSLGLFDIKSGEISFGEYVTYHMKSVKEKCSTLFSWIKRKVAPYLQVPAIGGGLYAAIGYK